MEERVSLQWLAGGHEEGSVEGGHVGMIRQGIGELQLK